MRNTAVADALGYLGYRRVYHMRDVFENGHQQARIDLLEWKFSRKSPDSLARGQLQAVLEGYDALADFLASIFVEELIAAYPDAKIVLLTRDEAAWYRSMIDTLWHQYSNFDSSKGTSNVRQLAETYHRYCWAGDFPKNGRAYFREYHERVRRLVAGGRMLEYDVRSDDWSQYKNQRSGKREMSQYARSGQVSLPYGN
ncbi:hypothetical protein B0A50_01841 [Salinomyces thailandicus]|uniref:Sulfotransferase family protein n=1 Tax=Salinomyces thailandicus TaxID=706561 RepID=A0A4U0U8W4_9PEZI|nr:hypothetical protein B0A50_01841 [Salinomyces thailandica]